MAFKVGQRVKYYFRSTAPPNSGVEEPIPATIVAINSLPHGPSLTIQFDTPIYGAHDGHGKTQQGFGWFIRPADCPNQDTQAMDDYAAIEDAQELYAKLTGA